MKGSSEVLKMIVVAQRRFLKLKRIFNSFQEDILSINETTLVLNGIAVKTSSDSVSTLSFIGRKYEIEFSVKPVGQVLKGNLSFYRIRSEEEKVEIHSVTYDGSAEVDVVPPIGEAPIILNEDNCSNLLVLNWLCDDANT
jgi:hypothetical protein